MVTTNDPLSVFLAEPLGVAIERIRSALRDDAPEELRTLFDGALARLDRMVTALRG